MKVRAGIITKLQAVPAVCERVESNRAHGLPSPLLHTLPAPMRASRAPAEPTAAAASLGGTRWGVAPCRRPARQQQARTCRPAAVMQPRAERKTAAAPVQDSGAAAGASASAATASLVNVAVGAGILSMPYAYSLTGWALGLGLTGEWPPTSAACTPLVAAAVFERGTLDRLPNRGPLPSLLNASTQSQWPPLRQPRCLCCAGPPRRRAPAHTLASWGAPWAPAPASPLRRCSTSTCYSAARVT